MVTRARKRGADGNTSLTLRVTIKATIRYASGWDKAICPSPKASGRPMSTQPRIQWHKASGAKEMALCPRHSVGHIFYCDPFSCGCLFREFARYPSRRKRNVGSAKQMPTRKIARKCQWKPGIFSRRASDDIQIVHAAAVINKSHVNPEITQVAKGAAKNSCHAASPRREKCKPKHRTGKSNPQIDKNA